MVHVQDKTDGVDIAGIGPANAMLIT
jgi:hypothetical protein